MVNDQRGKPANLIRASLNKGISKNALSPRLLRRFMVSRFRWLEVEIKRLDASAVFKRL